MKRKRTIKSVYQINDKRFDTFAKMKTWTYFNLYKNEIISGYKLDNDEIIKEYQFKKTERQILCTIVYDKHKSGKEYIKEIQLQLWTESVPKEPIKI